VSQSRGRLLLDTHLLDMAQTLVESLETVGLLGGAERFYQDLCQDVPQSFCMYGAVNAIFVLASGLHNSALESGDLGSGNDSPQGQAQAYLSMAISMLGFSHCLDFMESTGWPIHANDILQNLNCSRHEPFTLAESPDAPEPQAPVAPPPMSSLHAWKVQDLSMALSTSVSCAQEVRLIAVGTHPTLTMEAVGMLRQQAFASGQVVTLRRTMGITYKCGVFPEMCAGGSGAGEVDPIADLIGPFDSPPADHLYTLESIARTLEIVSSDLQHRVGFDALVCTSPYIICALLQKLSGVPLLGYFGLPILWKRPLIISRIPLHVMSSGA